MNTQNSASTKPKLIPSNRIKKENPTEIPCPECHILFPSQYQVNEHIKYLHQNRRKCDQCDIICHGKRALNAHKKTHDSRLKTHDSAEYHCEDCNTVCKSKQALRWHKQKSHGYKIFNCKCPMCEATFSNGWSLYWHKKREHGVLKKEESDETQEKVTHNVESFASPKLSLSDDSSADILQPISGIYSEHSYYIPSLVFVQDVSLPKTIYRSGTVNSKSFIGKVSNSN